MVMECSTYGKGVQLTVLRKRLETERLTLEERQEIEKTVKELEQALDMA